MNKLDKYISRHYENREHWFVEEVGQTWHRERIEKILNSKDYLSGNHKIKRRADEIHKGKVFNTKKIGLRYANTLLKFETAFTLKKPVTLTSNDEDALSIYKTIYQEGQYHYVDYNILSKMVKYGEVYEYVFIDENNRIKSILYNGEDSYPVYDENSNMIAFIYHYTYDGVDYYTVYTDDYVTDYNNDGGYVHGDGDVQRNASGLPIPYILESELDELVGEPSYHDYLDIIDSMEELLSKSFDAYYKFLSPLPIFKGNILNQKEGSVDANAVGYALQISEDSDFEFKTAKNDYQTFKEIYKTLKQAMLDISMTPGISMNSQEISNISETSIKMLYGMAEIKGIENKMYLIKGFNTRWGYMKQMIRELGNDIDENAYIGAEFNFNIPQNESEVVSNLMQLTGGKQIMSVDRAVEINPYTLDVALELDRLFSDNINDDVEVE